MNPKEVLDLFAPWKENDPNKEKVSYTDAYENDEDYELPFNLEWVFGHNPEVNIINLTDKKNRIIGFVSSNICGLYNLETKKCEYLLGHENEINSLCHDQTGRFIVTSDKHCVNVWDRECDCSDRTELIRSLESSNLDSHILLTGMSFDGKSIVTVDSLCNLKFWLWSFGNENPDDFILLHNDVGKVKTVNFSPNPTEYTWFSITTESHVIFLHFDLVTKKLIKHNLVDVSKTRIYNDSTYIHNSRRCISVTALGYGIIWSDVICEPTDAKITNKKNFLKSIQLESVSLNAVISIDGVIVVGIESGEIKFYDYDLKFLLVLEPIKFDAIKSIAFNLVDRNFVMTDRKSIARKTPIMNDGTEVWYRPLLPRDATLNKSPLLVRDFIVATKTGKIEVVNFAKSQSHLVLYKAFNYITRFDLHPTKPWICLGNTNSKIFVYHMENRSIIAEVKLPPLKLNETDKTLVRPPISCLSYSHSSNHLFCGLENGSIWMLDPVTVIPVEQIPLTFTYSSIDKIKFNSTSTYLAYTDMEFYLNILHYLEGKWYLIGRYREHSRYIIAVLWLEEDDKLPRLVTIGEDRRLVEYDLQMIYHTFKVSFEAGEESIKTPSKNIFKEYILEKSPVILSAVFVPTSIFTDLKTLSNFILITCDTHFKFKIYDSDRFEVLKTFVGPRYESPLISIKFLNIEPSNFIVFASHKSIGMQILPMDGNPYGRRGMIGSPNKIHTIRLSFNNNYLFTLGENEYSIQMWRINTQPIVDEMKVDRPHLEPFCNLLPGGKDGWLFKEIQDFFYYMQILTKGINTADEIDITDSIPVTELVDFMRGIGYFPSDYSSTLLMNEATRILPGEPCITQVSFRTVFKLYVNHRPIIGYKIERIVRILKALCLNDSGNQLPHLDKMNPNVIPWEDLFISKEDLLSLLTEDGEKIELNQALLYLKELLLSPNDDNESTLSNDPKKLLPNKINLKNIIIRLLGMPIDDDFIPVFSKMKDPSEIKPELSNKLKILIET